MPKNKKPSPSFLDVVPGRYIYLAAGLVIVALLLVTLLQRGSLYNDTTDYDALRKQNAAEQAAYAAELAAVKPDYEASRQFLKKVASEELVKAQIYKDLNVSQKVIIPVVPDSKIIISPRGGRQEVVNYMTNVGGMVNSFRSDTSAVTNNLFADGENPAEIQQAVTKTNNFVQKLEQTPVPKEAVDFHKAEIVMFQEYGKFLGNVYSYQAGQDQEPWAKVYGHYAVINDRMAAINKSFDKLDNSYQLGQLPLIQITEQAAVHSWLIPAAQAQIGGSITIKDFPRLIEYAVRTGLARAFAKFLITSLDKVVAHIEKNFAIASQLYYSEALGQFYSVEYMKKFVKDPVDQKIIQYFLPQYFCTSDLQTAKGIQDIFVTKAKQYVASIGVPDPNSPDYYSKISQYGDFMSSSAGWQIYYEGLASQTGASASDAASKEVLSPGIKTGRSLIDQQINKTSASIFNVQQAAIAGTINLGTNNAENTAAQVVAGVVESLTNKYVFTPLTGGESGGGIGVLQEQNVCIKTPQFKPVAPVPQTGYEPPPPVSNSEDFSGP